MGKREGKGWVKRDGKGWRIRGENKGREMVRDAWRIRGERW